MTMQTKTVEGRIYKDAQGTTFAVFAFIPTPEILEEMEEQFKTRGGLAALTVERVLITVEA